MAKPLRVLFVGYGQHGTTFLSRLAKGLAASGIQVTLATFSKNSPRWLAEYGVQRLWTPPWDGLILLRLLRLGNMLITRFSLARLSWLWRQIRTGSTLGDQLRRLNRYLPFLRGDWDVIYFSWNSAAIDYRGLYELGIPVVVSCRGSQLNIRPHMPAQEVYTEALQASLNNATTVHCVSADIQQSVLGLGVDSQKCTVIRPAVDPERFSPPEIRPHSMRFTLITTGSLIWSKDYESMLIALKLLVDAGVDAELHIIGEGPERQHITFTIHDLGLVDCVVLHGRQSPDEVRDQLRSADVFVLSSLSEGIANAVLEGMSCGLPVVTTDCGGMREAVTDGEEGFVIPVRDPQSMAAALEILAHDPDLRRRMGQAGRARVIKDFHMQDHVDAFISLFESTAADKPERNAG